MKGIDRFSLVKGTTIISTIIVYFTLLFSLILVGAEAWVGAIVALPLFLLPYVVLSENETRIKVKTEEILERRNNIRFINKGDRVLLEYKTLCFWIKTKASFPSLEKAVEWVDAEREEVLGVVNKKKR